MQINAYFGQVFEKNIENRSITIRLCVRIIFHSRKPRSCTEKRLFLHIVKRGFPEWTLNGEFFKNTEVLKKGWNSVKGAKAVIFSQSVKKP